MTEFRLKCKRDPSVKAEGRCTPLVEQQRLHGRTAKPAGKRQTPCETKMDSKGAGKCEAPLSKMLFYLDLKDFHGIQTLTSDIKQFGGTIESFLCKDITWVITNRHKSTYQHLQKNGSSSLDHTSVTPNPSSNSVISGAYLTDSPFDRDSPGFRTCGNVKVVKSRTDALLEKALNSVTQGSCDVLHHCKRWNLKIMHIQPFLNWLNKLKAQLPAKPAIKHQHYKARRTISRTANYCHKTKFVRHYLKFEDQDRIYRPQYRQFTRWPLLNLLSVNRGSPFTAAVATSTVDAGASKINSQKRQSVVVPLDSNRHTTRENKTEPGLATSRQVTENKTHQTIGRKETIASKTITSQQEPKKKSGYCEMCAVRYDEMYKHIQSNKHITFVKQTDHFKEFDKQMKLSPSLEMFVKSVKMAALLKRNAKENLKNCEATLLGTAHSTRPILKQPAAASPQLGDVANRAKLSVKRRLKDEMDELPDSASLPSPKKPRRRQAQVLTDCKLKRNNAKCTNENENYCPSLMQLSGDTDIVVARNDAMWHPDLKTKLGFEKNVPPPIKLRRPLEECNINYTCVPTILSNAEFGINKPLKENAVLTSAMHNAVSLEQAANCSTPESPAGASRILRSTARRRFPSSAAVQPCETVSSPSMQPYSSDKSAGRRATRSSPGCASVRTSAATRGSLTRMLCRGRRRSTASGRSSRRVPLQFSSKQKTDGIDQRLEDSGFGKSTAEAKDSTPCLDKQLLHNTFQVVHKSDPVQCYQNNDDITSDCSTLKLDAISKLSLPTEPVLELQPRSNTNISNPLLPEDATLTVSGYFAQCRTNNAATSMVFECSSFSSEEISQRSFPTEPARELYSRSNANRGEMMPPDHVAFTVPGISSDDPDNKPLDLSLKNSNLVISQCSTQVGTTTDLYETSFGHTKNVEVDIEAVLAEIMSAVSEPIEDIDDYSIRALQNVLSAMTRSSGKNDATREDATTGGNGLAVGEPEIPDVEEDSNFGSDDDQWDKSMSSYLDKISRALSQSDSNVIQVSESTCQSVPLVPVSRIARQSSPPPLTFGLITPPCSQKVQSAVARCSLPAPIVDSYAKSATSLQALDKRLNVKNNNLQRKKEIIPKHLFRRIHSESSEESWTVQLIQ